MWALSVRFEWERKPVEIFLDEDLRQEILSRWNEYGFEDWRASICKLSPALTTRHPIRPARSDRLADSVMRNIPAEARKRAGTEKEGIRPVWKTEISPDDVGALEEFL